MEASRSGLVKGEAIKAGVLEVDNALTADADKMVVIVEISVEAGLFVADVDTRHEMVALEQRQGAVDGAARERWNGGLEALIDVLGPGMLAGACQNLVNRQALRRQGEAKLSAPLAESRQAFFDGSGARVHKSIMNARIPLSIGGRRQPPRQGRRKLLHEGTARQDEVAASGPRRPQSRRVNVRAVADHARQDGAGRPQPRDQVRYV